jgi:hypothetical protein
LTTQAPRNEIGPDNTIVWEPTQPGEERPAGKRLIWLLIAAGFIDGPGPYAGQVGGAQPLPAQTVAGQAAGVRTLDNLFAQLGQFRARQLTGDLKGCRRRGFDLRDEGSKTGNRTDDDKDKS